MSLDPRLPLAIAAVAAPTLLAWNVAPSPTFLNQALALFLWGVFVAVAARRTPSREAWRDSAPLVAALALVGAAAAWAGGPGTLPTSLALSAVGAIAAAALLAAAGAAQRHTVEAEPVFAMVAAGLVVAGVAGAAIAVVQVFVPAWTDGDVIARSGLPGRAVGNLRQPNHLSSLLLWAAIAAVALVELKRLPRAAGALLCAAFIAAVVLTGSRTGLVGVLLLAAWGVADRRLAGGSRLLLLAAPLLYAAGAWAAGQGASDAGIGAAARAGQGDISSSRFGIWSNTLALITANPGSGVGFGHFNFAWTLTPFPGRPTAFFDHTHNLPLQLAVELGLPLAALALALLGWAFVRAARAAWAAGGAEGVAQRAALMLVAMIGLHSLLEYPLWYAYFLLPAAWAWGFALGRPGLRLATRRSRSMTVAGALLAVAALAAVADYARVVAVFRAAPGAAPLAERIADGRRSLLFAHHGDYAAATVAMPVPDREAAFAGATRYLLDTRLMVAWSRHLAATGRVDAARHVAQRLREFGHPGADELFAACGLPPASAPPGDAFACEPPARVPGWRELLPAAR